MSKKCGFMSILSSSLAAVLLLFAGNSAAVDLPTIMERGYIEFAVYDDFYPFSYNNGKGPEGIDVEVGRALAERLGVEPRFRLITADENMEDDLRNAVWKGHYIGGGVADAMLHVPYDPALIARVDQVLFVAPYYKEEVMVALDKNQADGSAGLMTFTQKKVGVETATLADDYLLMAYGGGLRDNVVHFKHIEEAIEALKQGDVSGVMGSGTQLQAGLGGQQGSYSVSKMGYPGLPESRSHWDLGLAVKAGYDKLGLELNDLVRDMHSDGTLEKIFSHYHATYVPPQHNTD